MENFKFTKELFQVLGNPTRLWIFEILMTGEHCNCEIADKTGLAINLISHHLKILHEAKLIQYKRSKNDARWIYYSINEHNLKTVQEGVQEYFNPNRIAYRDPVCPPCNTKNSKEICK